MFYEIDNFQITWAQWLIRQLELYTKIERASVFNFFLILSRNFIIGLSLTTVLCSFLNFPVSILILAVLLIIAHFTDYIFFKITSSTQQENTLPKEIITRKGARLITLICFVFWILFLLPMLFIDILKSGVLYPNNLLALFVFANLFAKLALELLLCTTSLPPGEKQKKVAEKELREMEPSIQN